MQHKIVIQRHRPGLRTALIGGAATLIVVGAASIYFYARSTTVSDFARTKTALEQLQDERRDLARQLRAARSEVAELRQQVVYVQRSSQIDGQACTEVKASLGSLQAESADLREQLAFYRGIVSPGESRSGVRVFDFHVAAVPAGGYRYDLVLVQSARNEKRVAGRVKINLIGSRAGKQESLSLTPDEAKSPAFGFRYFQELSGDFRLPEGFRPMRATVTLSPDGDGAQNVDDDYDWASLLKDHGKSER